MSIGNFSKVSEKQYYKDLKDLLNIEDKSYIDVKIPVRATECSAGYDFYCPIDLIIKPKEMVKIPTGIRCYIKDEYVLNIYPRSSLGFKYQIALANTVGIIDADYYNAINEGHIIIALVNNGDKDVIIKKGDRFAQGVFLQYYKVEEEEVTNKRQGGFGSSN